MAIVYTTKGNKVYIDDGKEVKLKGYNIYEDGGQIRISKGKFSQSLPKFLFGYGDDIKAKRIDSDIYDFRRGNLTFKKNSTQYTGVSHKIQGRIEYYVATYSINGQITVGRFQTAYDAAIAREYTIRKNKLNATPTGISLSDKQLNEEYIKVMDRTNKIIEQYKKDRDKAVIDAWSSREDYKHNIYHKNNHYYCGIIKNGHTIHLGVYTTYEEAAIVRNCYILENKLDRQLINLDIPIERQLEMRKNIKTVSEIKSESRSLRLGISDTLGKYSGINTQVKNNVARYLVQLRENGERVYVGVSKDIKEAAMMYNIYVIHKGLTGKKLNDVGLTIKQQKEYLISKGYTFNGEKFNKNKMKSISKKEPT